MIGFSKERVDLGSIRKGGVGIVARIQSGPGTGKEICGGRKGSGDGLGLVGGDHGGASDENTHRPQALGGRTRCPVSALLGCEAAIVVGWVLRLPRGLL